MTDYSKTILYKIFCKDINITDVFISYTTDFETKLNDHKSKCNNINTIENLKLYASIRSNGNWDNWNMIEFEKYPCNSRTEVNSRLREIYKQLKPTLNSNRQLITIEDRMAKDNATKLLYRENNKDLICLQQNKKTICECGRSTLIRHMERHCQSYGHKNFISKKNI
jgi:hypothetical protein